MPDAEQKIERASCWIDRDLVRLAKEIAAREGISASEAIERDFAPAIQKRHRKLFPHEYAELGGEAG